MGKPNIKCDCLSNVNDKALPVYKKLRTIIILFFIYFFVAIIITVVVIIIIIVVVFIIILIITLLLISIERMVMTKFAPFSRSVPFLNLHKTVVDHFRLA